VLIYLINNKWFNVKCDLIIFFKVSLNFYFLLIRFLVFPYIVYLVNNQCDLTCKSKIISKQSIKLPKIIYWLLDNQTPELKATNQSVVFQGISTNIRTVIKQANACAGIF